MKTGKPRAVGDDFGTISHWSIFSESVCVKYGGRDDRNGIAHALVVRNKSIQQGDPQLWTHVLADRCTSGRVGECDLLSPDWDASFGVVSMGSTIIGRIILRIWVGVPSPISTNNIFRTWAFRA